MKNAIQLKELIITHLPYLKRVALSYTKSSPEAEDLLQDALMRMWINQEKFSIGTNFKAWANTIIRNLFINEFWRQKTQKKHLAAVTHLHSDQTNWQVLNNGYLQLVYEDLWKEVVQMKEIHSRPIKLRREGFSYKEIAEEMGVSIGTVKSRLHSARKYMEKKLS